jgi:putative MATE family efflux protein
MTQGNIPRQLIKYSMPLLVGALLQQLYNAVDAVVVGNFVGRDALAAVGSTGALTQLLISFFMGMSSGASVLISRYFGAEDDKKLSDTVHTSMLLALIIGAGLSVIGVAASPLILKMMNTPDSMMPDAVKYLSIYFAGLLGLTVYNMGAAVLQSVGNSRYPLYFLIVSTVVNTIGDVILVRVFGMGVAGAAWATIFAEALTAVLVVITLHRSHREYRLDFRKLRLNGAITKSIVALGLPGAIQGAIVSISNVMVQTYMNGLGAVAVAGHSAANKLDNFLPLPVQTMALAVTTFVSQNLGAGEVKRARSGVKWSVIIAIVPTVILSVTVLIFHSQFLRIFSGDTEVLDYGWQFMRVFAPFYFVLAGTQIIPGALRGAGDVKTATFASIISFVVLRQIYLFFMTKIRYTVFVVSLGYPATWTLCTIIVLVHYLRSNWSGFERANRRTEEPEITAQEV